MQIDFSTEAIRGRMLNLAFKHPNQIARWAIVQNGFDMIWHFFDRFREEKRHASCLLIFTVLVAGCLLNCLGKSKWPQTGCMDTCVCRKDVGWLLTSLRFLRCKLAGLEDPMTQNGSCRILQIGKLVRMFYWFIEVCSSSPFFFGQFCLLGCKTSHLSGDAFRRSRSHRAFAIFLGN